MISNKLVAIDFGSTRIAAIAAEVLQNGEVKILSEESRPSDDVRWGIVEKPTGASFKVSETIKLLKNSAKINSVSQVSVSVLAKSMKMDIRSVSRFVDKSNVVTEALLTDMLEECENRVRQISGVKVFDVFPVSYELDGERIDDPVDCKGIQITANYHVVYGNEHIISELERCFDRTGIVLEHTPLAVEALSAVVLDDREREVGCALINLGGTTTTLAVYQDGVMQQLLVIPLGAKNITKDIMELGISEINAERLKCLKGSAMESMITDPVYIQVESVDLNEPPVKISTRFLSTIIEARLEETLQPIFDIIRNLEFELAEGIVLTGGGAKLHHLMEYITEHTGVNVRFGEHADWLTDDTDPKFHDPSYSQLVGTIVLANEYRKEHPVEHVVEEPKKKPKLPSKFSEKIKDRVFDFFSDDNKLD